LHGLENPLHPPVIVGEDRQQRLSCLLAEREVSPAPPRVPRPSGRDRCDGMSESEGVNLRLIGSGFLMDIPPVHPKTGRYEGALLTLGVFGIERQSEKLCLPCGDLTRRVGQRERECCFGAL